MPQKIPGVWGLAPNAAGKISDLPIDSFKDRRCYFATAHGVCLLLWLRKDGCVWQGGAELRKALLADAGTVEPK